MNHYKRIDKQQKKKLKQHMKEQEAIAGKEDDEDENEGKKSEDSEPRLDPFEERTRNIELARKKKAIENSIKEFKSYNDEDKKRELYLA